MTDSLGVIQYDKKNQPGLANLLTILSACTNTPIQQLVQSYQGSTYAEFKEVVADAVVRVIEPIQQQYTNLVKSTLIDEVLDAGAAKASDIAFKKVRKANQLVGVGRKR